MSQENKTYRIVTGPESIQGSPEWLAFRKGKISASIAPVIMGVSPWQTPLQLWDEIIMDKPKEKNAAMERGSQMEEEARNWLIAVTGIPYRPVVIQSLVNPSFIASLDGYYEDENGKVYLCEIKCPGMSTHSSALEGNIPSYYYPQLQHQMDLPNVDSMIYLSYYRGIATQDVPSGMMLKCERDKKYCHDLFAKECAFLGHLESFIPPETSDRDWMTISDSRAIEKSIRYQNLLLIKEDVERKLEDVKSELLTFVSHPRIQIGNLKMQQVVRKGNIDYERLLKDYEIEDAEDYRKNPTQSWRIQVIE